MKKRCTASTASSQHDKGQTDRRISGLMQVLEITKSLAVIGDLQTLLQQIENAAQQILGCERATVLVHDSGSDKLFSYVKARREKIQINANQGIAGHCFMTGEVCNIPNAYEDLRFSPATDNASGFRTRNILAFPMYGIQQNIIGVLEGINKTSGIFDAWDESLLETLAAQCGVALHRQFLIDEFMQQQRLQQELSIAEQIQRSLLPESCPQIAGYDIAAWNRSAAETGGDFFDFQALENDQLLFTLADVSGHGIGPALLAAECSALQRAVFSLQADISKGMILINKLLCQNIPEDRFVTAFVAKLLPQSNELQFISAGHGPVLLYRAGQQQIEHLPIQGMPLGIKPENHFGDSVIIRLNRGDMLIAMTDGFFEGQNKSGHCFGIERIAAIVLQNAAIPAAQLIESIYQALLQFCQGLEQADDLTAIIIKNTKDA